jgi:EAL domain-containing protein (putative c-di-GMP-specific phosphodiesterase class I)
VDYVKVDGHYVTRSVESARDRGFVSAMVDLAAAVGAKVIAERVETEAQATLMRELGVGYGQGFLFGRPGALPG